MKKTVAIIGGGVSGIVAAKEMSEVGFSPILFEKASDIGGLWNPKSGFTWDDMHTNLSHYNCSFSDFPWLETTQDFPKRDEVYNYLKAYIEFFKLSDFIQFETNVISIQSIGNDWRVNVDSKLEGINTYEFNFVIVASGFFNREYIPAIPGLHSFKGNICHSKDYKSAAAFKDKVVTVVGGGFSGIEICGNLASNKVNTNHILRQPIWILTRYINNIPIDLEFYKRTPGDKNKNKSKEQIQRERNISLESNFGNPGEAHADLQIDIDSPHIYPTAISDEYIKQVKAKKINVLMSEILEFTENSIKLANGQSIDSENVIFCTGYKPDISFFDKSTLLKLSYDENDLIQPIILYKSTFHPELDNLAFIGVYKGPFFCIMELQARWIAFMFLQNKTMSSLLSDDCLLEEENIRYQSPKPQFPRGNYIEFADSIANAFNAYPRDDEDLLLNFPVVGVNYRLNEGQAKRDVALRVIEQIKQRISKKRL